MAVVWGIKFGLKKILPSLVHSEPLALFRERAPLFHSQTKDIFLRISPTWTLTEDREPEPSRGCVRASGSHLHSLMQWHLARRPHKQILLVLLCWLDTVAPLRLDLKVVSTTISNSCCSDSFLEHMPVHG